ncbi:MAG: hypothetical protein AAFX02_05820 [Pseudomonadota bacterium]
MVEGLFAARASANQNQTEGNSGPMGKALTIFPLLVFPVIIYALMVAFASGGEGASSPAVLDSLNVVVFGIPMISGVKWTLTGGDALLLFALIVLSIELVKSTSTKSPAIMNHAASMALMVLCLVLFLISPSYATSVFFFILMMTVLDVLVGVMVTIVSARRDFGIGG